MNFQYLLSIFLGLYLVPVCFLQAQGAMESSDTSTESDKTKVLTNEVKPIAPVPPPPPTNPDTTSANVDISTIEKDSPAGQALDTALKFLEALDRRGWAKAGTYQWEPKDGGQNWCFDPVFDRDKWRNFGKITQERKLLSATVQKSYASLPDGEYYQFEFTVGLEKKSSVRESVVLGRGRSEKWKVVSYISI